MKKICALLTDKLNNNFQYEKLIEFVTDRPGHDYRYAIDNSFIVKNLDWRPMTSFDKGISSTVDFYLNKYQHE